MSSVLVINAAGRETRVALVEQGHIAEFYLERKKDKGIVGNIYKGRVTRVLPGMQAAFVDIGEDKAAFLYVGDVLFDPDVTRHQFDLTEGESDEDVPEVPEETDSNVEGQQGQALSGDSSPSPVPEAAPSAPLDVTVETAPAPDAAAQPSGAEVVAAAVDQSTETPPTPPAPSGSDVLTAAVEAQGDVAAVVAPAVVGETDKIEAQKTQAPRDVRFKEKEKKEERNRDRDRERQRKSEPPKKQQRIEDLLKVGQEVLVQVSKDPISTKGARITSHISIPGRHLVFMPTVDHVGISRRIGNEKERRRLRDTVERLRPPGTGFIVRTVAENVPQEKLEADIRFLIEVWNETVRKSEKLHRAGLMHPDLDLILRATRDLFANDIERLIIDDREEFERVQRFVEAQDPALKDRVVLHEGEEPIFDAYGIEEEIKRATARKVWLRSGGYLIIDQAEALTAIDVNSGRYVGKKNLEDTIVKINTEAAKEIVYQLRLRNIGGIIICDFIDMEKQQNRDKVFKSLHEALGRDKAKTNVLRISELGLVEMTRKRVRESIGRVLHENCGYCAGQGYVKTATTVAYEIFRELRRSAGAYQDPTLVVQAQTEVANVIQGEEREELRHLMDRFNKSIQVKPRSDFHREQYDIYARPVSGVEIKIAATTVEHDPATYTNSRKPGSNEAKFDRGGGGGGDRGERGERGGGERGERGGGERGERGGGGGDRNRGDRGDRNRDRDRNRGGGGGGGGGDRNRERNRGGGQNQNQPRPSAPSGDGPASTGTGGQE
jgi:ribonuclease G